jgi:hypothetical protein
LKPSGRPIARVPLRERDVRLTPIVRELMDGGRRSFAGERALASRAVAA